MSIIIIILTICNIIVLSITTFMYPLWAVLPSFDREVHYNGKNNEIKYHFDYYPDDGQKIKIVVLWVVSILTGGILLPLNIALLIRTVKTYNKYNPVK